MGAEFATLSLGLFLFVDDYLNIITNTKVSSLFSHRFKIPKIKICFLAACLAGPLCSLIPISSWGAEIITTISASTSNTAISGMDSFSILINSLPFVFFSLLIVCASFFIVWRRYSFGIIFQEESLLENDNNSEHSDVPSEFLHFNIWHFIFPIFTMVALILTSMLFFGNYFSGTISLFNALKTNPFPEKSLLLGTLSTLTLVLLVFLQMRLISFSNFLSAIKEGFFETITIFLLLSFSGTFALFIKALGTGELLCELAQPLISATYLPASIFATTSALAFLLGSSWATMIILIPATLPIAQGILNLAKAPVADIQYLMFVCIGAVLSGAVFGSSLSPISDLVNMATKSCQISHSKYLSAQLQYSLVVGISSVVAFLFAGFLTGQSYLVCWSISFGAAFILMIFVFKLLTSTRTRSLNFLKKY
jgi:Na+/H+ antiporter NhaC